MRTAIALFFAFSSINTYAQVQKITIPTWGPQQAKSLIEIEDEPHQLIDTLQISFWDDFSTGTTAPDSCWWKFGKDVSILKNIALNGISYKTAVFDGAKADGSPHGLGALPEGEADSLISWPFDLSNYSEVNSIYLSFYWQLAGLGERPDESEDDLLSIYFKNKAGLWDLVSLIPDDTDQSRVGFNNIDPSEFHHHLIKIQDEKYFHKGFQFKFVNHAKQTGFYDLWLLDHVYLGTVDLNFAEEVVYADHAYRDADLNPLNDFTAIPLIHLKDLDLALYWRDSVSVGFHNYTRGTTPGLEHYVHGFVGEKNSQTDTLKPLLNSLSYEPIHFPLFPDKSYLINNKLLDRDSLIFGQNIRMAFTASYIPTDIPNKILPDTAHLRNHCCIYNSDTNNAFRQKFLLSDYYAYDDGTAERMYSVTGFGEIAWRFEVLDNAGFLSKVRIYIAPTAPLDEMHIVLWENEKGQPGKEIMRDRTSVLEGLLLPDGFKEYTFLPQKLAVGSYFIGVSQLSLDGIPIGVDLNNYFPETKLFYRFDIGEIIPESDISLWSENEDQLTLMIRPVFTKQENDSNVSQLQQVFKVFPSPTSGNLTVSEQVKGFDLMDLLGDKWMNPRFSTPTNQLDISSARNGIYILRLYDLQNKPHTLRIVKNQMIR